MGTNSMTGGNMHGGMGLSEHDVTRVMAGDVESVRQRLLLALEQTGWRVLSEDPLRARRGARGGAQYYLSANVLEYPATLEIGFRAQGQSATRVTFDYKVMHGHLSSGDFQTLTREAEALAALAAQRAEVTVCAGCGNEAPLDSRFCRKCGAPVAGSELAELEVLRLTAGARAGYQWSVIGASILAATFVLPLLLLFAKGFQVDPKALKIILVMMSVFGGTGWWSLLAGLRRMRLTLNRKEEPERQAVLPRVTIPAVRTNELLSQPVRHPLSITEGTTDLLASAPEREAAPVHRREEKMPD
jgi:ribosomal protein L40E